MENIVTNKISAKKPESPISKIRQELVSRWQLYLMISVPIIMLFIFHYIPIYGLQIAFKDYQPSLGIWHSKWVGLKWFYKFFQSYQFKRVISNTLEISLYSLIAGFPIPIILALGLNMCGHEKFKKVVQTTTYAPYFISVVVLVGMIIQFLSPKFGLVNRAIVSLGKEPVMFMIRPELFADLYVWTGIWQGTGWGSIIYLAALAGIDPQLHEAAIIDGASRFRRVIHIDIPGILPTMIILLILNSGSLMSVGFEKALLMQNDLNLIRSEIISTYAYKIGLATSRPNYSYSTAIGLFNSIINFILLITVNKISKKLSETSLW
jgi:ABC-type polysaccharide transport system permease subunit